MFHSHLMINVGGNPDRPDWNRNRRWLRNLYRVHQRLCMAFPSMVPASDDQRVAAYCRPFGAAAFPEQRELPTESGEVCDVHQPRNGRAGFLFRIDYPPDFAHGGRRPIIIVQSSNKPNWNYAFGLDKDAVDDRGRPIGNAGFLLAAPPQVRGVSFDLDGDTLALTSARQNYRIRAGDHVRFRLRANPTRKVQDGSPNGRRKRINPTREDHADWLAGKLADAADTLRLESFMPGWAYGWRARYEPQPSQRMQWWSVLFEGTFRIKEPAALKNLLECGVGPAKGFGFGLLSVAPPASDGMAAN